MEVILVATAQTESSAVMEAVEVTATTALEGIVAVMLIGEAEEVVGVDDFSFFFYSCSLCINQI